MRARILAAIAALLALAPVAFWRGGVVEEEAIGFLGNYWGERGVLQRVFDPRGYDYYQGRELSYAVDFLDAQWLRLLLSHDVLSLFVAPSVLLAALSIVPIGLRLLPRALPRLDALPAWLTLMAYLSGFAAVSTGGILYRATKPLVAPLLLFLLLLALAEHRSPRLRPASAFAAFLAAGLAMALLDRQGLFYLLLLVGALAVLWWRGRRGLPLLLGGGAAAALWLLYNHVVGPVVIHAVNGYWPQMRFQRLRPERLADPQPWIEGARLLGDWTSVLLGGVPGLLLAFVLAALAGTWAWRERGRPRRVVLAAALVLAAAAAQLAMVAIMAWRHEPVVSIDHRFWYYPLPFQALVVFALLWGLERASARRGALSPLVSLLLLAVVLGNVAQWPEKRLQMESGPWFGDVARRSFLLVRSLREGRASPLLDGDYRRFYFDCLERFPRLGARAGAQVGEGGGIGVVEFREGRLRAAAEPVAHLVTRTPRGGPHVLAGAVHLPEGRTVSVLVGTPPRLLGQVSRTAGGEGLGFLRVPVELPPGAGDLVLLAEGGTATPEGAPAGTPFVVCPPFALWPALPAPRVGQP